MKKKELWTGWERENICTSEYKSKAGRNVLWAAGLSYKLNDAFPFLMQQANKQKTTTESCGDSTEKHSLEKLKYQYKEIFEEFNQVTLYVIYFIMYLSIIHQKMVLDSSKISFSVNKK